jgi:uncharacterized membrane protein
MGKARLEAFSDGVIAILITILVLELHAPHEPTLAALQPLVPSLMSYLLSFLYLGIYWNNHHHLLHAGERITGAMMWANLHLLFWLSLVPFVTGWMGDHPRDAAPSAAYGFVLLMAAIAFYVLQRTILRSLGPGSRLEREIGTDLKGRLSPLVYALTIGLAAASPALGQALYLLVALWWLVPDRRFVRAHGGT